MTKAINSVENVDKRIVLTRISGYTKSVFRCVRRTSMIKTDVREFIVT
jgi:hypothetical protein